MSERQPADEHRWRGDEDLQRTNPEFDVEWARWEGVAEGLADAARMGGPNSKVSRVLQRALAELRATQEEVLEQNRALVGAQSALDAERLRYRELFEAAPDGYLVTDRAGLVFEANRAARALLGDGVAGQPLALLVAAEQRPAFQTTLAALHEHRRIESEEFRLTPLGRPAFEAAMTAAQEPGAAGMQIRWLVRDVSERKRMEAQLRAAKQTAEKAEAEAEQANRAKEQFLAVLSHELRTPLTPAVLGLSLFKDRLHLDPDLREALEMVCRNVEIQARLIDGLLDVTRISQGKLEIQKQVVELGTVIQAAVDLCKPDIEARRLKFGVDPGSAMPCWVEADVPLLQQLFWILFESAIACTPLGGCVGIRMRREEGRLSEEQVPGASLLPPPQSCVTVEIRDSGMGIEPASLQRVFDDFEHAERSLTEQFGGLGSGLAISKAVVGLHGGSISVASEGRGKGATFCVRLPLTTPNGEGVAPSPTPAPQLAVRPLHILLVEDHGVTAQMIGMVLASAGHEVETAGSAAAGLELASHHTFDLMISDLGLPDASGYDLIRQIRAQGQTFPALAMSGYGQDEDIQRSHEAGFVVHLTKPASAEALVEAIASAAGGEAPTANSDVQAAPRDSRWR